MSANAPDLIILGRVVTLTGGDGLGWATGLAMADGRVVAAGTAHEIEALTSSGTRVWRLEADVVVMPSLTDAHLHLLSAALGADEPDLGGLDREGVLATVGNTHRERAATGDVDGWLTGHGWTLDAIDGPPEAGWLDAIAPGRPIALWSHDHHSRWLSTPALRASGLHVAGDLAGGRIVRDERSEPTGWLLEGAAGLVDASIPAPAEATVAAALGAYAAQLARLGVTGVHDPGGLAPDADLTAGPVAYRRLAERGQLPLRVVASLREEQLQRGAEMGFRSAAPHGDPGTARYRDGWVKLFADGALGSRTAFLSSPYETDDPRGPGEDDATGLQLRTREQLRAVVEAAAAVGIASQIHAIGDAATTAALDVLAEAPRVAGVRHRIEHAQLVRPVDVARFGPAGIAASVQACHLLSDAEPMRQAWGPRSAWAFPLAALAAAGTLLPAGTDAPVESPDPWRNLSAAMTRRSRSWPDTETFHPQQALGLARAIRSSCLDGPRSLGLADQGHLGVGAHADLMVVPSALFDAPPAADLIETTRPLATVLEGEVIAHLPAFDP